MSAELADQTRATSASSASDTFAEFYAAMCRPLQAWVSDRTQDSGAAEDIVAETFMLMWTRWSTFDGADESGNGYVRMRAYAFRTAAFKLKNLWRTRRAAKSQVVPQHELEAFAGHMDTYDPIERAEALDELRRLPDRQRSTLWLRGLGYDDAQVAARLGVSRFTVKNNLGHARRKLTSYHQDV